MTRPTGADKANRYPSFIMKDRPYRSRPEQIENFLGANSAVREEDNVRDKKLIILVVLLIVLSLGHDIDLAGKPELIGDR